MLITGSTCQSKTIRPTRVLQTATNDTGVRNQQIMSLNQKYDKL